MKPGDKVTFTGASIEQVRFGGNDDPNKFLKVGDLAEIESVEVRSWHTKIRLKGVDAWFNNVSFKKV